MSRGDSIELKIESDFDVPQQGIDHQGLESLCLYLVQDSSAEPGDLKAKRAKQNIRKIQRLDLAKIATVHAILQ